MKSLTVFCLGTVSLGLLDKLSNNSKDIYEYVDVTAMEQTFSKLSPDSTVLIITAPNTPVYKLQTVVDYLADVLDISNYINIASFNNRVRSYMVDDCLTANLDDDCPPPCREITLDQFINELSAKNAVYLSVSYAAVNKKAEALDFLYGKGLVVETFKDTSTLSRLLTNNKISKLFLLLSSDKDYYVLGKGTFSEMIKADQAGIEVCIMRKNDTSNGYDIITLDSNDIRSLPKNPNDFHEYAHIPFTMLNKRPRILLVDTQKDNSNPMAVKNTNTTENKKFLLLYKTNA